MKRKIYLLTTLAVLFWGLSPVQPVFARLPAIPLAPVIAVCDVLTECYPTLNHDDCVAALVNSDQISNQLGGPETDGSGIPYSTIVRIYNRGSLAIDRRALRGCISDLEALTCSDDLVLAAWDSSDPTNFDNIENIFPDSCGSVYR